MNTQLMMFLDDEENEIVTEYAKDKQVSKQNAIKLMILSFKNKED